MGAFGTLNVTLYPNGLAIVALGLSVSVDTLLGWNKLCEEKLLEALEGGVNQSIRSAKKSIFRSE